MPTASTSLVHAEETTQQFPSTESYGDIQRRSCMPEVTAAGRIYDRIDSGDGFGRGFSLRHCRDTSWFARHDDTGEVRIASKTCHLRWCPLCADSRRNFISFEVESWIEKIKYPKFLTLTLRHSDEPLLIQINKLYKSFVSLRRRKHFKNLVNGGIWFFQIKKSKSDHKWHPHLHCLIGGLYIPHSWLTRTWEKITFGSTIVDIRPINDPHKACNDAARYASKPAILSSLSFEDGLELVEVMHGRRIVGSWGSAREIRLRAPRLTESGKWQSVGTWEKVMSTRDSDQNARAIAYAYYNNQSLPEGITCNDFMADISGLPALDLGDFDLDAMYPSERSPPCKTSLNSTSH